MKILLLTILIAVSTPSFAVSAEIMEQLDRMDRANREEERDHRERREAREERREAGTYRYSEPSRDDDNQHSYDRDVFR